MSSPRTSLIGRTFSSISWNIVVSVAQVVIGFIRSILLARLLSIEVFGIYAFAGSIVGLSSTLPDFGMRDAFIHRTSETEDEGRASAVYFSLQLLFTAIWMFFLIAAAFLFTSGLNRVALLSLTIITVGIRYTQIPQVILTRRIVHRRLALLQLINVVVSALVAVGLAELGMNLWALLSTDIVTFVVYFCGLYLWRPVWKPRLAWSPAIVRYYLRFGIRNTIGIILWRALDKIDDLWVGAYLGETPLGLYSRAYTFATYPRKIVATPVNTVALGTYAELKGDRKRISRAFFSINALLLRSGFLLAGLLVLLAPEFVSLLLGDKWLPMLDIFRLMLLYTLLDPIRMTVANLLVAVGKPESVASIRGVQFVALLAGLFLLGSMWGTVGVALAVDLMTILGILFLLRKSRSYVDFSYSKLFAAPSLSLGVGLLAVGGIMALLDDVGSLWTSGGIKGALFASSYGVTLFILERQHLLKLIGFFKSRIKVMFFVKN